MEYLNEHWDDHHLYRLHYNKGPSAPNLRVVIGIALSVMLLIGIRGEWTDTELPDRYDKYTDAWMWWARETADSVAEEYPSGHVQWRRSEQDRTLTVGFYGDAEQTALDRLRTFGARHDVGIRVVPNMGVTYRDLRQAAEAVFWYLDWEKHGEPLRYFVGTTGWFTVTVNVNLALEMDGVADELQRLVQYRYGSDTRLQVQVEHDPDLAWSGATWRRWRDDPVEKEGRYSEAQLREAVAVVHDAVASFPNVIDVITGRSINTRIESEVLYQGERKADVLTQITERAQRALDAVYPGLGVEIRFSTTKGERITTTQPLP